jgi:uncharacterized membrane protein YeiB
MTTPASVISPAAAAPLDSTERLQAIDILRGRFGPLEWVWRTLTYARYQPLRRAT